MRDIMLDRMNELFRDGGLLCAESVLTVLAEAGGNDPANVIPLATGFCSGMSRTKGQCGAVSGAVMGLGLYAGRRELGGDYEAVYCLTQEFLEAFVEEYGSVNCFDLVECDFATEEGKKRFRSENLKSKCHAMTAFATATALELLQENEYLEM